MTTATQQAAPAQYVILQRPANAPASAPWMLELREDATVRIYYDKPLALADAEALRSTTRGVRFRVHRLRPRVTRADRQVAADMRKVRDAAGWHSNRWHAASAVVDYFTERHDPELRAHWLRACIVGWGEGENASADAVGCFAEALGLYLHLTQQ